MTDKIAGLWRLLGRWCADKRGASAVQFVVVLPVFVLVVIGLWAFFSVYSARDALCDATREATRYLQVEGPRAPDTWSYPADWRMEARKIVESELKSHQWYSLVPVALDEIMIFPEGERRSPADMREVSTDELRNNWFFVRATKTISNPLAVFLTTAEEPSGRMTLSCQSMGFFEGDPIRPTPGPGGSGPRCPLVPKCTVGPPPPDPTDCPEGENCCPLCRP